MVSISKTRIANMALSHVGAEHDIESLAEISTEADAVELWYDYSLQQALEAFDWSFARKRIVLTLHGDTISTTSNQPLAGVWGFRYKYPNDCIVVRKMQHPNSPPDNALPFEIELSLAGDEKTILTNVENAVAVYTMFQQSVNLFSPSFVLALSFAIAANIAFTLTGKLALEKSMQEKFFQAVNHAAAHSLNEAVRKPPRDADWIRDRAGVGTGTVGQDWRPFADGSN